ATDNSKILDRKVIENFSDNEVFVSEMIKFAEANKGASLITIPCGDEYSKLLSNNKEKIKDYYKFNTPSTDLNDRLENKIDFYNSCEELGIPYPKFAIINSSKEIEGLDLQFPLIL
ncbi:carboxylate--amine ligase, partial [Peptoniphilus genitalis]